MSRHSCWAVLVSLQLLTCSGTACTSPATYLNICAQQWTGNGSPLKFEYTTRSIEDCTPAFPPSGTRGDNLLTQA